MATTEPTTTFNAFDHFQLNNNNNNSNDNDNNHNNISNINEHPPTFQQHSDNIENLSVSKYFMEQVNAGLNGVFDAIISSSTNSDAQTENQSNLTVNSVNAVNDDPHNIHLERINELENLLKFSKNDNQALETKLQQQQQHIEILQNDLKTSNNSNEHQEIDKLRDELQAHTKTVKILIDEKNDLSLKITNQQQQINEYEQLNIELQARLNASRHRVTELERDLNKFKQTTQNFDGSQQTLSTELEQLQDENKRLKRLHQEACDESTEIQHQLTLKSCEVNNLKEIISEKVKDIEMLQLRLEQLTSGDLIRHNVSENHQQQQSQQIDQTDYERQIIELQNIVSELSGDRDRLQQQYQTYVQHLTRESTTLQQRVEELTEVNEKLKGREKSLVNHISDLERQFQKQLSTQQRLAALRDDDTTKLDENESNSNKNDVNNELQKKLKALEMEKSDLNVS